MRIPIPFHALRTQCSMPPKQKTLYPLLSYIQKMKFPLVEMCINDGSKTASQDRCSSACGHTRSARTWAEGDGPCPCLPCSRTLLPQPHDFSRTNRDPLYFCQHIRSLHSIHSRSSATWCTDACHSCTSSPASRLGWGSRSSSLRRGYNSTHRCQFGLSSSRCSWEGIPARVGLRLFVAMQSRAHAAMPTRCWIRSRTLVGARQNKLGLGRSGGMGLS